MTEANVHVSRWGQFDQRPLLVFWEMTKACQLACFHCRANAQLVGAPDELTTSEGRALIDSLASIGAPRPILILTGGDCLMRDDVVALQGLVHQVFVEDSILDFILRIVAATRTETEFKAGVSVRGGIALRTAAQARALVNGRDFVLPDDVTISSLT